MRIERWQAVIAFAAVLLIATAITIEHPFVSTVAANGHASYIFNWDSVVLLLTELGVALIIALAISMGIERRARERDNSAHDKMRRLIAEDVFKGVFAEGLPRAYIDAVVDRNLRVQVIRPWVRVIVDLSDSREGLPDGVPQRLLRLDRKIEFELENVSGRDVTELGRIFGPIQHKSIRDLCQITLLKINEIALSKEDISGLRRLEREETNYLYEWPIIIRKGETVKIEIEEIIFKDKSDNEIWSSVYPTMKYETIFRSGQSLKALGMRARTAAPITSEYCDAEKGIGNWVIDGPILPNDSITTWWAWK